MGIVCVPPECFLPATKVTSAVLRLTPKSAPACVHDEKRFFRVVRGAFGQRRKTLLNSLSSGGWSRDAVSVALDKAGISPTARAEELTLENFARLSENLPDPASMRP